MKSERLAMAHRLLLAYAFVLPGSSKELRQDGQKQESSSFHVQRFER
jgi:hypothetical protein